MGYQCVDCIHVAQGRYQLWAVVNTVMNLWGSKVDNFMSS
jgi:hypothetical protein